MIIKVDELDIILSRKRVKHLNLRINAQGQVKVSAPMRLPLAFIQQFIQSKRDWIQTRRASLVARQSPPALEYKTGACHLFLGQSFEMVIAHEKQARVMMHENKLHLFVGHDTSPEQHQALLQTWYRKQMLHLLPDLVKKWEEVIGVSAQFWGIKAMKTRWGSCHPIKKRIWLNLHLIQKPLICLEYVIVHELVHLLEASHNHRFHALMSQYMPEWKAYKKLLRQEIPRCARDDVE